jgi:hypothetical protein
MEAIMTKYEPLEKYLENKGFNSVPMSFSEIESIIHSGLPPSARKHRAWWSNNPSNSVITYAWLAAGYKTTDVNLEGETVVFRKQTGPTTSHKQPTTQSGQHPLFGCMEGLITIPDDIDLTAPADPDWGTRTYQADD